MNISEIKIRNFRQEQHTKEQYNHGYISAWKDLWEQYDEKKGRWDKKSGITCHLTRDTALNLGGCNNGYPFTSVNQAVNVAKGLCNYDDERKIEEKLRSIGFKNEDFFKYNSLKDLERIRIKQELYERHIKKG